VPSAAYAKISPLAAARPIYLERGRDPVAALYHQAAVDVPDRAAVVICAPWGWDEVASYRTRRRWAERLAAAGHPTLRFDLTACGDSAATPRAEGLVGSWMEAVTAACAWLRTESGAPRVALLGLGLGGLLAQEALSGGAEAEELVLWGTPKSGRAFVRETRAFSAMQAWSGEDSAGTAPGSVEAGGFLLDAETKAALAKLGPAAPGPRLRRALLLERDGLAAEPELLERLRAAGTEVATAPGEGWGVMVSHPERSQLAVSAADRVERWLADGDYAPPPAAAANGTPPQGASTLRLRIDGAEIRETAWTLELPFGRLFGVLAEPAEAAAGDRCALFLNAGAIRHVGPNRLWVEAARRAAAQGVPSLRLDLEALGESDGDEVRLRQVGEFFVPAYVNQLRAVLDSLEADGKASRFVLVGLCAGAYWSFRAALEDPRIGSVLLFNSGALIWSPNLVTDRAIRELSRIRSIEWWRKLGSREHRFESLSMIAGLLLRKLGQLPRRALQRVRRRSSGSAVDADLNRLQELGTRVTLAFSGGEALHFELGEAGILARLEQWPNMNLEEIPGNDHSLRPLAAQAAARALIEAELGRFGQPSRPAEPQRRSIA
jgi:alpha-beta hydrolase superfamily lysophospholipase